jgi:hypothetical protein
MKTVWTMLICLLLLPLHTFAREKEGGKENKEARYRENKEKENKEEVHGHERAARHYERRSRITARQAEKAVDPEQQKRFSELSKKYQVLADNKREALKAEQSGRKYDWGGYERTRNEVKALEETLRAERKNEKGDRDMSGQKEGKEWKSPEEGKKPKSDEGHVKEKDGKEDKEEKGDKEEKPEPKPEAKTFKTESGFLIRTSL